MTIQEQCANKKAKTFEPRCSEEKVSGPAEASRDHDAQKQTWGRFIEGAMGF